MSTWNKTLGNAFLTTAVDSTTSVQTKQDRVKVGYPCSSIKKEMNLLVEIFDQLESVSVEVIWNRHPRMLDIPYQHEMLKGNKTIIQTIVEKNI